MSKKFEVRVSGLQSGTVVFNKTNDILEATQLALALHQSSGKDIVVDVFYEGSSVKDVPFVHLFKSAE